MVEWGNARGRPRGGRGRVETWPEPPRGRPWALPDAWPSFGIGARLRPWAVAETAPGRLFPWLPVAFGLGIAVYFTAEHEPLWWAGAVLTLALIVVAIMVRARPVGFPVAVAMAAAAAGFATASGRTAFIAHPVLTQAIWNADVTGFVETREERERSDRIVVRVRDFAAPRGEAALQRVRVAVRKGTAPPVGSYVGFKARLSPPLSPLRPGGYDFARELYFQRIGATGFVLGSIRTLDAPEAAGLRISFAAAVQGLRDDLDRRIRTSIGGDRGAIASALITGKRDAISAQVNDAMYVSSLAHILSISGYHMALVAGVVFFVLRAVLALSSALARRRPIKKWAACAALAAATFYLVLSGAEVATQRAYIMTAVVLVGVMIDRPALTLRTLAIAALAVMLIAPQAVVHPSFQMSFAATLALIAAYERGLPWAANADTSRAARVALWGGREVAVLVIASMVAGLATTPYAAYHFHRISTYGVLANLAAMPVVSAWVMPAGLLALLAMPFGLDGWLWRLMGEGIGVMIAVASFVAALPGALVRMPAFGTGALLLGTGGLLLIALLRSPLRWSGVAAIGIAIVLAVNARQPDVLVSADGQAVAVRQADGRLAVKSFASDVFAIRAWLAADGDPRSPGERGLADGFRCDASGCIATLPDGRMVARVITADAFEEDCEQAAVLVTTRDAPPACAALTVDRKRLREQGALSLRRTADGFAVEVARPMSEDRPWAPRGTAAPAVPAATTSPRATPRAPDATPPADRLEADD